MAAQEKLTIPGEARLTRRIREAAGRDALGHAAVLSGRGDLAAAARFLAAAMECRGEEKPCGDCPACRKVLRGVHPDVVTVADPEHRSIAVGVLRGVVADACVLPNEGRRKIYIFPDCALLDGKAQNVLLKVLEEGPPHAAFLFCAANSAVLLPTIRSRAVEWRLSPAGEEAAEDDQAWQLCRLICSGSVPEIVAFCSRLESGKISREALQKLLSDARDLIAAGMAAASTGQGEEAALRLARQAGGRRLSAAADSLEEFVRQCGYNIGVGHLAGALAVRLSEICR